MSKGKLSKVENRSALTYKTDVYDFLIDIVRIGDGGFEAWIYRQSYGVKNLMFGVGRAFSGDDIDAFIETVEANMYDYMKLYDDEYKED